MKTKQITIILIFLCFVMQFKSIYGQAIAIESLKESEGSYNSLNWPKDLNGITAAKINIITDIPTLSFDGNIIGDIEPTNDGYQVFLTDGTKKINIKCPGLKSLFVDFSKYYQNTIKSGVNYILTINTIYNDDEKDIEALIIKSNNNDPIAMNQLAVRYQSGIGVKKDVSEAIRLYHESATSGNSDALYNLGMCYMNGIGLEPNNKKAFDYLLKSAEKGHIIAQKMVGSCYFNGVGTEKSINKGLKWTYDAAQKGESQAQYNLGWCYYKGLGVDRNVALALGWFIKSALQNHIEATFMLGECFSEGNGIAKDYSKAFDYYMKASEAGHRFAQYRLSECYANGIGVKKNKTEAKKWRLLSGVPENSGIVEIDN